MNKTDLIDKIAAGSGLSKADSKKALDATVAAIKEALVKGDKVQLIGFGTFEVKDRAARTGRNPQTGEPVDIPAKRKVKFTPNEKLKDLVKA